MHYDGTIIRPPNEAESIILQVALGCSHNKCAFCGAYKDKSGCRATKTTHLLRLTPRCKEI
jgi:radical SAM superfamily enzyme YgiQ (UPF0313 family)